MDIQLNGTDGVTGTRRLLERHPGMQVLVLTGLPLTHSLVRDVAESGASGLFPKSASLGVVVDTIPTLRDHSFAVDRRSLVSLCESVGVAESPGEPGLLLPDVSGAGHPLPAGERRRPAERRFATRITVNTARGYVKNLYRKLGCTTSWSCWPWPGSGDCSRVVV